MNKHRPLSVIAAEIRRVWAKPNYAAVPYLVAMSRLTTINNSYGAESARSIVLYFLSNVASFRGDDAKRLKAELKEILAIG